MRLFLLLIIAQFLVSCQQRDPRTFAGVHPEFRDLVAQYESLLGKSIGDVAVNFQDRPTGVAGSCITTYHDGGPYHEVVIDPDTWDDISDEQQMALLFHELAHCVQGRPHLNSHLSDGCPKSMMHENLLATSCIKNHEGYYLKELFDKNYGIVYNAH